nr:reverse transcriptase domain-containing protein [Tanacetum cinerariifolium]
MDAMTIKMDAQYKELQSRAKQPTLILMMTTCLCPVKKKLNSCKLFVRLVFTMITATDIRIAIIAVQADGMIAIEITTDDKPYDLQKQFNDFMMSQQLTNVFVKEIFMYLKTQLETVAKNHQASIQNLETKFDRLTDKQSGRPSGSLPSNTQPNPRDEGSKILYSIEGTLLEEVIFAEFDEFMAITVDSESESDTEEPPFEKITNNTDYKIKTSLEEYIC